jgi:2-polyprenyl-6-methoxyphenol hydroxylase-like FAD-dependent oxidoreductase
MRAAVVGCGVAGMAAALALARRGHEVTLFEVFDTPQPLGSGLLLQPSGLAALRALDLIEPILEQGARVDRLDGRDMAGRGVMAMAYDDWRPGAFGLGIHRGSLFQTLHDALAPAGVELRTGCDVVRICDPARPLLRDSAGDAHGPFDLALIDAVELAEQLEPPRPVAVSLAQFQARRRRQTGVYQLASRGLTPLFQSGGWLGPLVRDLLFTPLARAPGLRWLSALVLTGVLRLGRTPRSLRP